MTTAPAGPLQPRTHARSHRAQTPNCHSLPLGMATRSPISLPGRRLSAN